MARSSLPPMWAGPRRFRLGALLGLLALQTAMMALVAWLTRGLFIALGSPAAVPVPAGAWASWPWGTLAGAVGLVACACGLFALRVIERQSAEQVAHDYVHQLRSLLIRRLARTSQSDAQRRMMGQVTIRLSGDMAAVRQWISQGGPRLVAAALALPVFAVVLFLLDPMLAGAALGPVAVSLGLLAMLGPRLRQAHRQHRDRRAQLTLQTLERLRIAPLLRNARGLDAELRLLQVRADALQPRVRSKGRWTAIARHLPDWGAGVAAALVLGVAVVAAREPADTAASLAALGLLAYTLSQLADVWDRWHAWRLSRRLLERTLATRRVRVATAAPGDRSPADAGGGAQPGQGVPDRCLWLEGWRCRNDQVPLTVPLTAGARISLHGPAGLGKSHVLRALAGIEDAVSGALVWRGVDDDAGRDASPAIAVVVGPPRVLLVSALGPWLRGSLEKNLTLGTGRGSGRAKAAEDAVRQFELESLQNRLARERQRVHEQANNLSSRERLLVLLARAWLRPPDLMLVDLGDWESDPEVRSRILKVLEGHPQAVMISASSRPIDWGSGTERWALTESGLSIPGPSEPASAAEPVRRFSVQSALQGGSPGRARSE